MNRSKVYRAFRARFPAIPARGALHVAREASNAAYGDKPRRFATVPNSWVTWRVSEYPPERSACGAWHSPDRWHKPLTRRVENPAGTGLRFVGFADELASLRHTGWFTDDDGCGETLRGAVWQLPSRDGCAQYVAGYLDPHNSGPALVEFDVIVGERGGHGASYEERDTQARRDAARRADSIAEREAEREREHQRKWQAARDVEDLRAEIATAREEHSALAEELRALRASHPDINAPKACAALRSELQSMRRDVSRAVKRIRELIDDFGAEITGPEYN